MDVGEVPERLHCDLLAAGAIDNGAGWMRFCALWSRTPLRASQSALSFMAGMKRAALKLELTESILAPAGRRLRHSILTALVASYRALAFFLKKVSGFY